MSGDLQTRKRKDKRRKKEDEGLPFQPNIPHITPTNNHSSNDDLNIHVHKEGGLGGGICAKLVFFVLFSALAVLIGLIITEHRGLTDVDVVETNSKFAQIFEGWTDPSIGHHENDHEDVEEVLTEEHDDHDEEEEEEAEHNVSEEEHDDHDEEDNDEEDEENEERSIEDDDEQNIGEDDEEQIIDDDEDNTAEDDDNTNEDDDNTTEDDDNTAEDDDKTAEDDDNTAEDDDNTAEDDDNTAEDDDNDEENEVSEERTSYEVEKELDESSEVDNVKESEENEDDDDEDDDENYNTKETTEDLSEERNELSNEKEDDEEDDVEKDDDEDTNQDDSDETNAVRSEEENKEETEENISEEDKLEESEEKDNLDDSEERDNLEESEEKDKLEESEEKDKLEESEENDTLEESEEKDKDMDDVSDEKDLDSGIEDDDDDQRFARGTEGSEETVKDVEEDENKETDEDAEDQEEEVKSDAVNAKRDPEDENVQESSGMAVKVGVGVALLVVAHLVLCRKWRSASVEDKKESTPDLSRRNTIIVPPTFQEIEQDIKQDEEDLSDEEEELSEQEEIEPRTVKDQYVKLRSTYSRSLSPEGETLPQPQSYEDENEYDEEVEEEISEEEDDEEEGDIEEDEDNDEDYDEYENEELLKRLDAKYGKLPGSDDITKRPTNTINEAGQASKENYEPSQDIDEDFIKNNPANAVKHFEKILEKFPSSSWNVYGNALALNYLADQQRSNEILYKAIQLYIKLLKMVDVPDSLYKEAVERTIKVMRFVGQYKNLIEVHRLAINKFPDDPEYYNEMAVTYLTINRIEEARAVLKSVLKKWPNDGFALVHQGFILKTADNKLEDAVEYLRKGIATNDTGVIDGRFYFHLGDALERLGRHDEAMEVYEKGTKNKVFFSKYQRSLYNVQRLTGKPYWDENELPYSDLFRLLKQNWRKIRDEGLSALNSKGFFQDESENLRDRGEWKQFELFARGFKNKKNCAKAPFTCSVIEQIPEAKGCKRGQTKFSVMHPGTHVWPHCGPTNCRLRVHLGLKVPPNTFLRVADETRSWKEGKLMIFDDSFEHEVWHNGTEFRLVLIVDIWHPELTASEKRNLSPI